jgi:uncharacterized protein (TIGR02001 family)
MKLWSQTLIAAALLTAGAGANAEFSSTITATSDYDFRGVSLSAKDPALQISADYAFGESGFAVGAWASNLDYGNDFDGDLEVDLYGSYAHEFASGLGLSGGFVYYAYPDSNESATKAKIEAYPEIYAGISYKQFSAKYWFTDDYGNTDESASYVEANFNAELPAEFSLGLHVGRSFGDYWSGGFDYADYSIALSRAFGYFTGKLMVVTTDANGDFKVEDDVFNNEARVILSISTTLPWGE